MVSIRNYIGVSALENVRTSIEKAKEFQAYNVFISLNEERALERARLVDSGEIQGRLAGVPFVVKDNFLTIGGATTAASNILKNFNSPLQATAVEKLEAEGAICIGKTNLDAFAHGGSTENSIYGPTLNAVDKSRVAGGSSGGSAVATALGIVPFALGTDTGGSIRQPASFNGVVGIKPTYGSVSRFGVIAMASSTDTIGCFTANVSDAEIVMDIIMGRDKNDMTTLPNFFNIEQKPSHRKIGMIKEFMQNINDDVRLRVEQYADELRSAGHTVEYVDMPILKYALAMYYIIVPAEISSNLARYDGIRFGSRVNETTLGGVYGKSRDNGFTVENKRRIMIGSYVLSSGFFDAYYLKAQKARTLLINDFDSLFKTYDALLGPVSPTPAFKLGENSKDPVKMYMADILTVPASLCGLPAISVPGGTSKEGLPVGIQLIGQRCKDAQILAIARSVQEKDNG